MDPQKLSQLDPKLRDAYQRVMGTSIPQPQVTPASPKLQRDEPVQTQTPTSAPQPQQEPTPSPTTGGSTPIQPPASEPQSIPMPQPAIPESQPAIPQPQPIPTPKPAIPQQPTVQPTNFDQMNSAVPVAQTSPNLTAPVSTAQAQTITIKKKNHLMPILIVIVFLVFIAVYALFWTKIFNFKLPFLP